MDPEWSKDDIYLSFLASNELGAINKRERCGDIFRDPSGEVVAAELEEENEEEEDEEEEDTDDDDEEVEDDETEGPG